MKEGVSEFIITTLRNLSVWQIVFPQVATYMSTIPCVLLIF